MAQTIRVKRRGPQDLYFEVATGAGDPIATSSRFETICRLESGLAVLIAAAQNPERAVMEGDDETTSIGSSSNRKRVQFVGRLTNTLVLDLLSGVDKASVVDERPASQRRADLSGRLCELDL